MALDNAAGPQRQQLWADKYKPQSVEQMCYPVCANRLKLWMQSFDASGTNPKAMRGALLSGPPGVGKTTSVYLVAKALGKSVIEYNASDFRSKKSLHEGVASVINNRVFASNGETRQRENVGTDFVLLMDEVDGCDLGGVGEVIAMIKKTKVPVLCTCNDRWHPKLRSLLNYVEDIRFTRPPCNIVANFICETVLAREGVSLSKQILQDIIKSGGSDLRNVLNNLQMWSTKRNVLDQKTLASCAASSFKNGDVGLFEAAETFLLQGSSTGNGPQSVPALQEAYYNSDLVDLFVQENYLHFQPSNRDWLSAATAAAHSISCADGYQRVMYVEQNWSVSNAYVLMSSILPCATVRGHYQSFATGQAVFFDRQRPVKFPTWLGNNSSAGKNDRLLTVLAKEGVKPLGGMSGTKSDVALDYVPLMIAHVVTRPLVEREKDGIAEVMRVMDAYHMTRDDWDFVQEIGKFRRMESQSLSQARRASSAAAAEIATAVKSAFTREFNKNHKLDNFVKAATKGSAGSVEEAPAEYADETQDDTQQPEDEETPPGAFAATTTSSMVVTNLKQQAVGPKTAGGKAPGAKRAPAAAPRKKAPGKRPMSFIEPEDT